MRKNTLLKIFLLFVFVSVVSNNLFAAQKKEVVNILTWWGYLNYPEIVNAAKKKCDVDISFDQYYSNDEFLRRWEIQKEAYQVIIFSDTIYDIIKNKIPSVDNSKLLNHLSQYNKTIKNHYIKKQYQNNVVYFIHAMTGFLWNPEKVYLSPSDSINSIFKKAQKNLVVIIDDPAEVKKLIKASLGSQNVNSTLSEILTINNFNKMIDKSRVYITNNYSQIYTKPDFAFSFSWSGEAMVDLMASNKNYKFLIHPRLSYISSDLLAQTSNSPGSQCVATFLSSKEALDMLQEKDFYFSPYAYYSKVSNKGFKEVYKEFVSLLPKLSWIDSVNENDFHKINKSWQLIKLSLNNQSTGD